MNVNERAAALLAELAQDLKDSHTVNGDWRGDTDAQSSYNQMLALSQGLKAGIRFITAAPVKPDDDGFWTHPAIPDHFDEDPAPFERWLNEQLLECVTREVGDEDGGVVADWEDSKPAAAPTAPAGEKLAPYEHRVNGWMMECFGPEISADREERNHRFLEEALELVQSTGCTADAAHRLVDYVFGRPLGEPRQEVGGVRVTLAALCLANGIDGEAAAEAELARITQPEMVERIREKQKRKPAFGPLPGVYPERTERPVSDPDQLPDRVLMPRALTAENGAKTALMGEFTFSVTMTCPECHPDEPNPDCEVCAGSVEYEQPQTVPWTTIKKIYAAAVEMLASPAPDEREIAALKSLADVQDNALSQAESLLEQIQEEHRRKHDRADPLTAEVFEYIQNVRFRAEKEGADHG